MTKIVGKIAKKAPKRSKLSHSQKKGRVESSVEASEEVVDVLPHFDHRPPKYKTVAQLQGLIDNYFRSCWEQRLDMFGNPIFVKDKNKRRTNIPVMVQKRPYTITGLALAIGTTRDTLLDYENKKQVDLPAGLKQTFSDTIKKAKQMCHGYAEDYLFTGKNPAGAIFNLKNNYNWHDKIEEEHSGSVSWHEENPK